MAKLRFVANTVPKSPNQLPRLAVEFSDMQLSLVGDVAEGFFALCTLKIHISMVKEAEQAGRKYQNLST
jgi:hypothetical protein